VSLIFNLASLGGSRETMAEIFGRKFHCATLLSELALSDSDHPSTMNGPLFGNAGGGVSGLGQMGDAQAAAAARNVSFTVDQECFHWDRRDVSFS
jgi:hypothetical protein